MLQQLTASRPDLIIYQKHLGATLTPEGQQSAAWFIRGQAVLACCLNRCLGYPPDMREAEAGPLALAIPDHSLESLIKSLKTILAQPNS